MYGKIPYIKSSFTQGKWAEVSYDLCDRYIPYALGGGYGLGWRLVKHIARLVNNNLMLDWSHLRSELLCGFLLLLNA